MRLVRWPGDEPPPREPSVVTLGVFDGVHLGHAEVIRRVVASAGGRGCRAVVVTFDRHPAAMLSGEPLPAITSLDHRLRLFESLGVNVCVVVQFSPEVSRIEAEEFARRFFFDMLGAVLVVIGYDCRFGRDGRGDAALLARMAPELGWEVCSVAPVEVDSRPVSSTLIRQAVMSGDLSMASRLLGRALSLYGTVIQGDGRGRAIGFPTANLDVHNELLPPDGVYAVWVAMDARKLPGVASIGRRETFHGPAGPRVAEVHLVGADEQLYGAALEVQFVAKLRDQAAFVSPAALADQIRRDVEGARRLLGASE